MDGNDSGLVAIRYSKRHRQAIYKKTKKTLGSTLLLMGAASSSQHPWSLQWSKALHRIAQCFGSSGPEARQTICLQNLPLVQYPQLPPTLLHIKSCKHGFRHGLEQD